MIDALEDLHKQATLERSHFYVGKVAVLAQAEIKALRWQLEEAQRLLQVHDAMVAEKHATDCECADCWQQMEASSGLGGSGADKG